MRVFSFLLFALMAAVLPVAGVQQYFCTVTMAFMDCTEECPADDEKDCCEDDSQSPSEAPDCLMVAKTLPNAEPLDPTRIAAMDTEGIFMEIVSFGDVPEHRFETLLPLRHRGPPDLRRTYVLQRRLLI